KRNSINAGKTCHIFSTVNPLKAATAEYQASKQQVHDGLVAQFPQSHHDFQAYPQGATFLAKQSELEKLKAEVMADLPADFKPILGAKLAEIDTLSNLIVHFGPADAE